MPLQGQGFEAKLVESNTATGGQAAFIWPGGQGKFQATHASWSGATVKLQASIKGTWVDVPSNSLTANGMTDFDLPPGQIRAHVSAGTGYSAYALARSN